jgi:hypothetical protein
LKLVKLHITNRRTVVGAEKAILAVTMQE